MCSEKCAPTILLLGLSRPTSGLNAPGLLLSQKLRINREGESEVAEPRLVSCVPYAA